MIIDLIGYALGTLIVCGAMFTVGFMLGKQQRQPTRIIAGVKKVDNRVMPDYSRAQRRAHKRRSRG